MTIDDDTFEYEGSGGMKQCISGFGRNAVEAIITECGDPSAKSVIEWHINELVRWCRHFNGKLQAMEQSHADMREEAKSPSHP